MAWSAIFARARFHIDGVTLIAVSAALVVVVITATVLPARQAMAVGSTEALRDG